MIRTLLLVLLLASPLWASDTTPEGQAIIAQARSRSDIRELSSFTMKADLSIENRGKQVAGRYVLLWNGPDQWREEIVFPGFDEIRVGGAGTVAEKRSLDFVPLRIYQLQRVLAYGREGLALRSDEKVAHVRSRKVNGTEATCVQLTSRGSAREICVDRSSGALIRDRPFVDKGFAPIGTIFFPHSLSYVEEDNTVAEAEITELTMGAPLPAALFELPAGAVSKPDCLNPTVGRLINKVDPRYPIPERLTRTEGTVAIYAVIGTDGSMHNLQVVSSVSPGLDQAALDAVEQWRYEPFMCQNTPVEFESVIQVAFRLHY